jgi:hypothetical protein
MRVATAAVEAARPQSLTPAKLRSEQPKKGIAASSHRSDTCIWEGDIGAVSSEVAWSLAGTWGACSIGASRELAIATPWSASGPWGNATGVGRGPGTGAAASGSCGLQLESGCLAVSGRRAASESLNASHWRPARLSAYHQWGCPPSAQHISAEVTCVQAKQQVLE